MYSKRGRKRNDNLPPNRARDVQRAFRARRAAHLQALEQRVEELEEENNFLRKALHLPPSNRPPLGKGPTGKDKSKSYEAPPSTSSTNHSPTLAQQSRAATDSPRSRRGSISHHIMDISMTSSSSQPMQIIEGTSSWNSETVLGDSHQLQQAAPGLTNPAYHLTPTSVPSSLRPPYPVYMSSSLPSSSSRGSVSSDIYNQNDQVYLHSPDRPLSQTFKSYNGQDITSETHKEPPRHHSYTPSSFHNYHHDTSVDNRSPPPGLPMGSQHLHLPQDHRVPPVSYAPLPHRRCMTDPHGFFVGQSFPEIHASRVSVPTHQAHDPIRQAEPLENHDTMGESTSPPHRNYPYSLDGRLNHHPNL